MAQWAVKVGLLFCPKIPLAGGGKFWWAIFNVTYPYGMQHTIKQKFVGETCGAGAILSFFMAIFTKGPKNLTGTFGTKFCLSDLNFNGEFGI